MPVERMSGRNITLRIAVAACLAVDAWSVGLNAQQPAVARP